MSRARRVDQAFELVGLSVIGSGSSYQRRFFVVCLVKRCIFAGTYGNTNLEKYAVGAVISACILAMQVKELSSKYHLNPNSHVYANLAAALTTWPSNAHVWRFM